MNSRVRTGIIIAIAGFLIIAVGLFFALRFINLNVVGGVTNPPPTQEPEVVVQAVFATRDIPMGAVISEGDVRIGEYPIKFATKDMITSIDQVVGRISKTDLVEGESILKHNLADPTNVSDDIAYILDEKHVLMAMPATDLMSREAIIKRGDIVDILVSIQETLETIEADAGTATDATATETPPEMQQVTFSAFQKIGISAVVVDILEDPNADEQTENVTPSRDQIVVQAYLLALNPQDALVIKYLKDTGGVFDFVIRAPTSTGQFDLTPVTAEFIKELYGLNLIP